ncbi:MAG: prolipoprotein diacylglyceryl transferase [Gammaproteobacteria bacterium]|nr:prolipoprotein diacylglyceryl transferase [Gammaproteobacteria bacterium]
MLTYPHIDPIAFHIGPVPVHWYGLMYLAGLFSAWLFLQSRLRKKPGLFSAEALADILFYGMVGLLIGGRLGYMVFYDLNDFIHAPWIIFMIWQGGMAFHGGLLGVIIALWFYAKRKNIALFDVTDFIAPAVPLGLAFGRIGNFINGELWGRVTTVPWAMVFPHAGAEARHPSQLYEFFLEGILLFTLLALFSRKTHPRGAVSGLFLLLYGAMRFSVEFFRQPDAQIGFVALGWMTKGQLLSLPMMAIGVAILCWAYRGCFKHATVS